MMETKTVRRSFTGVRIALSSVFAVSLAVSAIQCSADSGSANQVGNGGSSGSSNGGNSGSGGGDASANGGTAGIIDIDSSVKDYSAEDFFLDDPPPMSCDGGGQPVSPGGTPECPDDKNLPGCPCTTKGETKPCWPGYRRHRNHGNCADGMTTCDFEGETNLVWGECMGYTGIDPNTREPLGTTGKAACGCFSAGRWEITNLSPCFHEGAGGSVTGAVSTTMTDNMGGAACPGTFAKPSEPWSTNWVTVDCTGRFRLCFTLKALSAPGAMKNSTSDCIMQEVCTEAYYGTANARQEFPPLDSWITDSTQTACAEAFVNNGGYAEMSVDGQSDECEMVNKIFNTVDYCPLSCNTNPNQPECANCGNGGSGQFGKPIPEGL